MESKQLMSHLEAFSNHLGFALKWADRQAALWYGQRRLVLGMAPRTEQLLQQHPDTRGGSPLSARTAERADL